MSDLETYLTPAPGVSCDEPRLWDLARSIVRSSRNDVEAGVRLFEWVRDKVAYSAYVPFWDLRHYHASTVLGRGCGYCVQKSALLVALCRSLGFPARLSFADIENHLVGANLAQYLGTNIMTFHCFAELFLGGKWVKATPSFERELCRAQGWRVVEFNGREDALLPPTDLEGRPHVTYLRYHFSSEGVPLERMLQAWEEVYGAERMRGWRQALERNWPEEVF